jgi:hypothetical protein
VPNISDDLASAWTAHDVDLTKFEAREQKKLLELFKDLERELIRDLQRIDPTGPTLTAWQRARAEKLLASVRKTIREHYRKLQRTQQSDLRRLAQTEVQFTLTTVNATVAAPVLTIGVGDALLKAMVNDLVVQAVPSREWWSRQAGSTFRRFGDTVRQGMIRGESVSEMTRSLRGTGAARFQDGVFARSERDLQTLVRTSTQSIANAAYERTFEANADVVSGKEWLTAFENVCPICRPLHGQAWTLDGRKLPGTELAYPGPPPRH